MSNTYGDAAVMDKEEALAFADQEAAEAVSALASAGDLIQFNSGRHQQIVSLARRVRDLQMRSKMFYAAPGNLNVVPPRQKDLADLAQENKRVQQELEALQGDLANDFRSELALIDKLVTTQAILESLLLVGVLTALFFRTRALISATVRRRGDEVLRQAHRDTEILLNSIPSLLIELDARAIFDNGIKRQRRFWNGRKQPSPARRWIVVESNGSRLT